jgi:hypothetical protein
MAETGYRVGMRHALSVLIPVAYGVCAARIEAGRSPLDLVLFFWRHLATFEQVRNKVGHRGPLSLCGGNVQNF